MKKLNLSNTQCQNKQDTFNKSDTSLLIEQQSNVESDQVIALKNELELLN